MIAMNRKIFTATAALMLSSQLVFAAEHTVQMKNVGADGTMVFEPAVLNVAVGDTVHFEPTDMAHNAESVNNLIPEGSAGWNVLDKLLDNKLLDRFKMKSKLLTYQTFLVHPTTVMAGQVL